MDELSAALLDGEDVSEGLRKLEEILVSTLSNCTVPPAAATELLARLGAFAVRVGQIGEG